MKRELAALETTSSSIQRETRSNKRVGGSASEVSERLVYTRVKKKSTAVRVRKPELFSNGGGDGGSNGVVEVSETSEVVGEPNDVKEAVIGSPEVDVKDADDFSEMAFEETDVLLKDVEVKDEVVFEDQGLTTSSKGDSEGVDFPKGGNAETVDEVDGNGDEVVEEVSTKAALVAVNGKGKKKRPVEGYPRRFTRSALKSKVDTVTLDKNVVDSKAVTSESNGEVCKEIVVYSETLTTETDESNDRVKKKTTETYTRRATRSAKKPKMDDIDLCIVEPVPSDIEKPVPVILDSEKAVPATSSEDVGCDVDKVSKEPSSATTRRKLEMKMSKQISLAKVPTSVQELFETGLLEGCPVYYDKGKGLKLNGRVRGIGILCFCALCKGCKVIPPSVFEIHAIDKYKRAVEYIYLENGRSLIKVLKACKSTRLNTLEATVQNAIGPLPEKKFFVCQNCKEAFFSMDAESSEPVCSKCVMLNLSPIGPVYSSRKRCRSSKFVFPSQAASTYDMVHDSSPENSVGKSSKPALSPKPSKSTFVGKSLLGNASAKLPRSREELLTPQPSKTLSALKSSEKNSGKITRKDIRLHKLVFEDDVLPDGTELGYYARGQKLLDGHKKGFGIFCNCCNAVVSASQFEAHAGCASRRKPYCYIYTSNGVSLHELSITLIKDHRYSVKYNDDLCSICADGGSLLLCDGCPRAFHMECASLPSIPRGKWYCKYCQNMLVRGNFVAYNANALAAGRITGVDSIEQIIKRSIRIVNNLASEVSACILCRGFDFCKSGFGPRTIILCDQCEKEYHVGCLKDHNMADLTELPDGKWFCSMECGRIEYSLENLLARGVKKLPESLLDIIQKKNLQICSDSGTDFEVSWRLLSGKIASPETRPWLSQAVAIFHESFAPIIDVVSRNDLIPAMVYGRNVGGQEYGGMYCAVLTANKVVVSAGIFRIFGPEVAELPLVATSSGNHGKGYFQTLFACIERLLAFLNIKTLVLPAAEEAVSIWTDRFGFTQMTLDQIRELKMNFWSLVQFQGTSMLHKLVPKCHYLENLGE